MHTGRFGMRRLKGLCLYACILAVGSLTNTSLGGEMRYQINLSYVDGLDDLGDLYEDNWEQERLDEGYWYADADIVVLPVGLSFHPYYQWDSGLRIGAGIGPIVWVYGDVDHFEMPLSATAGYALNPSDPVTFYVFGGPSYHVTSGDYVDNSNIGGVVGAGVELIKKDNLVVGVEASYDSASLDIDDIRGGGTKEIATTEFSVGVFILFK